MNGKKKLYSDTFLLDTIMTSFSGNNHKYFVAESHYNIKPIFRTMNHGNGRKGNKWLVGGGQRDRDL